MFIDLDFYKLYYTLNGLDSFERETRFENLNEIIFKELGIAGQYEFKFVETANHLYLRYFN